MNVGIFWVRAMKCMYAQTRPRFILSSERVFGGMEFEPMLTPREKSPLPENFPRGGSNPRRCGQGAQTLPTSYSSPQTWGLISTFSRGIFSRSSHTSDLQTCTPVATLPGAWCCRVNTGTGQPGVSILWLGKIESLFSNFCLSVTAYKIVKQISTWDTVACCWDVKQPPNKVKLPGCSHGQIACNTSGAGRGPE